MGNNPIMMVDPDGGYDELAMEQRNYVFGENNKRKALKEALKELKKRGFTLDKETMTVSGNLFFRKDNDISLENYMRALTEAVGDIWSVLYQNGIDCRVTFHDVASDAEEDESIVMIGNGFSDPMGAANMYQTSYVTGENEPVDGYWYEKDLIDGSHTAAHEFLHLLGLSDRYLEGVLVGDSYNQKNSPERYTIPVQPSWDKDRTVRASENIMADVSKTMLTDYQKNIIFSNLEEQTLAIRPFLVVVETNRSFMLSRNNVLMSKRKGNDLGGYVVYGNKGLTLFTRGKSPIFIINRNLLWINASGGITAGSSNTTYKDFYEKTANANWKNLFKLRNNEF